jgi:hypothetical protein
LLRVNGKKTPGYPLNLVYGTNDAALTSEFDEIARTCVARLHLWMTSVEDFAVRKDDPYLLVEGGYVDPSSIFIKDEPHPKRKVADGRYRCITPVSLVDQVVEAILFTEMADATKGCLYRSGSAIGIGFTDRQIAEFVDFCKEKTDMYPHRVSDDVSGFDALHTLETLMATHLYDKKRFVTEGSHVAWWRAHERWVLISVTSCSVFESTLYTKSTPGMLNSGSRDTSRRNTSLRVIYGHYILSLIGRRGFVVANGDDSITWADGGLEDYHRVATERGFKLREVTLDGDRWNFCSHEFDGENRAPLTSWPKSVYRILTAKDADPTDTRQALEEMRYNEEYPVIAKWLDEISPLN